MTHPTDADAYDWFGALRRSFDEASVLVDRDWQPGRPMPVCVCGRTEHYKRPIPSAPVDLRGQDVGVVTNTSRIRPCRHCPHPLPQGQVLVHHRGDRRPDYYHAHCALI